MIPNGSAAPNLLPGGSGSKIFRPNVGALTACVLGMTLLLPASQVFFCLDATAQTAAAATAARQIGTVKSISGNALTLTTDAGQSYSITVLDGAKILQLAPGSTNLASAQVISLANIAPGDRVLVTGTAGDTPDALSAARVILMKADDLAQKHADEQADWQKRGSGGLVGAVDPATGTITITARGKQVAVQTTAKTTFRRYANDSVKFEAAQPGTLAQIQAGDQLRVRGDRSADGASIQAEEIVSGAFKNLSGTIASVNIAENTLTLKDLATKKSYTVSVTANSSLRTLPAEAAARFAARARGDQGGGAAAGATATAATASTGGGAGAGDHPGRPGGSAGMDLSQMLARLPEASLKDLHTGDAIMLVASQSHPGSDALTAVTLLSGVEPILAATPKGGQSMTLSPWSVGSEPEGPGQQ